MWDLTKILAATPTVEEAAEERPIFRLDPMIEARALLFQNSCHATFDLFLSISVDSEQFVRQVEVERGAVLKSIVRSKERSSAVQNIWFVQVGTNNSSRGQ